jgi:hypothetical protein
MQFYQTKNVLTTDIQHVESQVWMDNIIIQGITFKEHDRAAHLTAPLKNNKGR